MMKQLDIIKVFVEGWTRGRGGNLYIDGNTLYSYGKHFPLAVRLISAHKDNSSKNRYAFILNNDSYSKTTTKHKNWFIKEAGEENIIKKVNTQEMGRWMKMEDIREPMLDALD